VEPLRAGGSWRRLRPLAGEAAIAGTPSPAEDGVAARWSKHVAAALPVPELRSAVPGCSWLRPAAAIARRRGLVAGRSEPELSSCRT